MSEATTSDVPVGLFEEKELKRDLSFKELKSEHRFEILILNPYQIILCTCNLLYLLYYSKVVIGDMEAALYKISVLIDPISETAQKWSTLLKVSNMSK